MEIHNIPLNKLVRKISNVSGKAVVFKLDDSSSFLFNRESGVSQGKKINKKNIELL